MHWGQCKTVVKRKLNHIWANGLTISSMEETQMLNV